MAGRLIRGSGVIWTEAEGGLDLGGSSGSGKKLRCCITSVGFHGTHLEMLTR